jgi:hypothetical protein
VGTGMGYDLFIVISVYCLGRVHGCNISWPHRGISICLIFDRARCTRRGIGREEEYRRILHTRISR